MLLVFAAGAGRDFFFSPAATCIGFFLSLPQKLWLFAAAKSGDFDWKVSMLLLGQKPRGSKLKGLASRNCGSFSPPLYWGWVEGRSSLYLLSIF